MDDAKKVTYAAELSFVDDAGGKCVNRKEGFDSVEEATEWLGGRITNVMLYWSKLNPWGIRVYAEVSNDSFCDCYEIKMGM